MSDQALRSSMLRIASGLPVGDPARRKLLAALRRDGGVLHKGDLIVEFPPDRYDQAMKVQQMVVQRSGGLIEVEAAGFSDDFQISTQLAFRIDKDALDRLVGRRTDKLAAHRLDGVRGHQLMPGGVKSKIPKLYSGEDEDDPMVWVKYFSPYTGATWLVTEFDGSDTMFGWADLGYGGGELGYISLRELEGLNRNGLPLVERDLYFRPKKLSQAKRES